MFLHTRCATPEISAGAHVVRSSSNVILDVYAVARLWAVTFSQAGCSHYQLRLRRYLRRTCVHISLDALVLYSDSI